MRKYIPALVCGFGAAVFTTIPGLKNIVCCLLVPIASVISLRLYLKANPSVTKINTGTGLMFGLFTGLVAAFFTTIFDLIITFITHSNDFIYALPQTELVLKEWNLGPLVEESLNLMKQMGKQIQSTGFSALYTVMIIFSNSITYSIFGLLGGAVGVAIINKRSRT